MLRTELTAVFGLLTVFLASLAWGRALCSTFPSKKFVLEQVNTITVTGLGILGSLTYLIGILSTTVSTLLFLCIAPLAFLSLTPRISWTRMGFSRGTAHRATVTLLCFVLFVLFMSALAEPAGDSGHDGIRYHLMGPQVWLRDGYIHPVAHDSHTAFPSLVESLYMLGMGLWNDRVPGLLGALFFLLLILEVSRLARDFSGSPRIATFAALFVASMPVAINLSEEAFVDVPFALFAITGTRIALSAYNTRQYSLAGVLLGCAVGTKYTGLFVLLSTAICSAIWGDKKQRTLRTLILVGIGLIVGSPAYIRNYFVYGTPIFPPPPFFASFLPIRGMSVDEISQFHASILERGRGLGVSVGDFLLLPFRFTYYTQWFHGAGGIGIVLLALSPFGFVLARQHRMTLAWITWCFLLTILWFLTQQEARFLIHVCAVLAVFAAIGAEFGLQHQSRTIRWVHGAVVLCSVVFGLGNLLPRRVERITSLISPAVAQERRERSIPWVSGMDFINSSNDVRGVIVLRGAVPVYFLKKSFWISESSSSAVLEGESLLRGATHILDTRMDGRWVLNESNAYELVFESFDTRVYRFPTGVQGYVPSSGGN